jgi:hypothetical protein
LSLANDLNRIETGIAVQVARKGRRPDEWPSRVGRQELRHRRESDRHSAGAQGRSVDTVRDGSHLLEGNVERITLCRGHRAAVFAAGGPPDRARLLEIARENGAEFV